MLTFDRMKIISNINNISNINHDEFITHFKGDELLYYKYKQNAPFLLLIQADYKKSELVIEFTGKILQDYYKELINRNNISQCLNRINDLGICHLDVESIIRFSRIGKCDITKDVSCNQYHEVLSHIRQHLTNHKKWNCKDYTGGIVIENTVSTARHKKRLTIYGKGKELAKATNADFLQSLSNPQDIQDYFKDKIRFELNINTESQIRKLLNISTNDMNSVLNSTSNPILTVFDEAIKEISAPSYSKNLNDYKNELLLKECDFDLAKVEAKIRTLISKNTSIQRIMEPYKKLYQRMFNNTPNEIINLRSLVE